jgi:hypothetical protein
MITTKLPFRASKIAIDKTPKLPSEFNEFDDLLEG